MEVLHFPHHPSTYQKVKARRGEKKKSEQQVDTIYTMRQMLEHNMVNCEDILKGEGSLALPNYSEDQRKKLEYQYL